MCCLDGKKSCSCGCKAKRIAEEYDREDEQLKQIIDTAKKIGFKVTTLEEFRKQSAQKQDEQKQSELDEKDFQTTELRPDSKIGNINEISMQKMSPFY